MPNDPHWVAAQDLITLNVVAVTDTGEPHLVRDLGLLESAAGVPYNRWAYGHEEDLVSLATALLFAVARNHPFEQGNKRTGFLALDVMLKMNSYQLALPDEVSFAEAVVAVIVGDEDELWFAELLRPHVRPVG